MKNYFLYFVFCFFSSGVFAVEISKNFFDRVVAVVNGEIILASDLNYELRKEFIQKSGFNERSSNNSSKNALLDKMINEMILLQRAKNLKIIVDPIIVKNIIADIAKRGDISTIQLVKEIEKKGLSFERFEKNIEKELIFSRLREIEVESQLRISENEIDLFLEFNTENNLRNEEVLISQYKVSFKGNMDRKSKKELRKKVIEKMSDVNDSLSIDGSILRDFKPMGWRTYDRLPKIFVSEVQLLKQGEYSKIIESPSGFHVLRLDDRRSSLIEKKIPTFKVRHILLKVDSPQQEKIVRSRLLELRGELLAGAIFSDLAMQFSEDIASSKSGGELGWAYPGDFVPEFESAINQMKIGEISQPVRSMFGYHLIELIEKKDETLTPERQRTIAKMILRESKLEESTKEWIRELRTNSYVDIKQSKPKL